MPRWLDCCCWKTLIFIKRLFECCRSKRHSNIPGNARLWRAAYHRHQFKKSGELKPGFFQDSSGLSCDWANYVTAKRSRLGFNSPPRPHYSGLVEIFVQDVRSLASGPDVAHKPMVVNGRWNYAHCQITKKLTSGEAKRLVAQSRFRIRPNLPRLLANS